METLQVLGGRLRELRKEKKLKQRELAAFLDITEVHYRRVEAGKINIPTLTLCALADYYGVTTDYLLGRSDQRG
ncbi:helix-turn-helix transcriptional regulator [uncultured Oscillibacter sp.]|uniref:helix-turn-helix domain-containing protein n=1 Tax=uncultured Oscillibacter sp. TaxID=876091 RepID=UPI001F84F378|nr:helix-turn-helix transcriptional regulator [uncultured Oscillibacter sp.]HJB31770.1 helix-turn-helix domain-containing protein [Candidatus Oscillibacter excrementavium]